jgi:hypothetical protein
MRAAVPYAVLFASSLAVTTAWLQWERHAVGPPFAAATTFRSMTTVVPVVPRVEVAAAATPAHSYQEAATAPAVNELARRILESGDSDETLRAMQYATTATTEESIQVLLQIMASAQDVRVRLAAITLLRQQAENRGDADGQIRSMLYAVNGPDTQTIELATETAALLDSSLSSN